MNYQNQGLVGQIIRPADAKPASEIEVCFGQMEEQTETLMKCVSELLARVQPVCRTAPDDKNQCEKRAERTAPVAERINRTTDALQSLRERVQGTLSRLEL